MRIFQMKYSVFVYFLTYQLLLVINLIIKLTIQFKSINILLPYDRVFVF